MLCSDRGNFCVRHLAFGSLGFLATIENPVFMVLVVLTVAQVAEASVALVGARDRILWIWLIACWKLSFVLPVDTQVCLGVRR